jgi:hypothetical protein
VRKEKVNGYAEDPLNSVDSTEFCSTLTLHNNAQEGNLSLVTFVGLCNCQFSAKVSEHAVALVQLFN